MVARILGPMAPISITANRRIAEAIVSRSEDTAAVSRREYLVHEIGLALDCAGRWPIGSSKNEAIARHVVNEIKNFRTVVPFGNSWLAFATAEVLVALNTASGRAKR